MTDMIARKHAPNKLAWALLRGMRGRCPNCGRGHLYRAYLKPVDICVVCAEALYAIRADDGPAWATILIVGHVVVGVALLVEKTLHPAPLFSIAGFVALTLILTLALLPKAKGAFIGAIWATGATGEAPEAGG